MVSNLPLVSRRHAAQDTLRCGPRTLCNCPPQERNLEILVTVAFSRQIHVLLCARLPGRGKLNVRDIVSPGCIKVPTGASADDPHQRRFGAESFDKQRGARLAAMPAVQRRKRGESIKHVAAARGQVR